VRNTVKTFAKISAALCAAVLAGVIFAASLPACDGLIVPVNAAQPSYKMTEEYKSGRFYENFTSVKLTGDERRDVIAIALSQLGYHEGDSESDFDGESADGVRDFVEYNVLAGKYDNAQGNGLSYGYYWCASFVNWCMRQAGVSNEASAGSEVSCQRWLSSCSSAGIYKSRGSYIPRSGDIIFFRDKGSSVSSTHVGLVLYVNGSKVYTVEGNTSFTNDYSSDGEYVAVKNYSLDSTYIVGYAAPRYNDEKSNNKVDYSGGFKTEGQYIPHGKVELYRDVELSLSLGSIDAFTLFDVTEVGDGYLAVDAKILDAEISGYISSDADVVQVTSSQEVFIIQYLDADGNAIFSPQYRLKDQKKKTYSNAPTRSDRGFVGWKYQTGTDEITLGLGEEIPVVSQDVILVAVFDENFYLVSFQNPDKTLISQSYGYYGTPLEVPDAPRAPDGYVFVGWDAEVGDVITGNATYTAVFVTEQEYESMTAQTESVTEGSTDAHSAWGGCNASLVTAPCLLATVLAVGLIFRKKK